MSVRVQEGCNGILLKEDRRRFRVFDLTTAKRAQGLTVHHLRDADGVDIRIVVVVTCHLFQLVALFIAIFGSVVVGPFTTIYASVVVVVTCQLFQIVDPTTTIFASVSRVCMAGFATVFAAVLPVVVTQ